MPVFTPGSLNLGINPLTHKEGDMIRCVNVTTDQFNAKKKRPGYSTYLGTPDNAEVTSLFNFTLNNGTQFWNYRLSGSVLYYSQQGTGDWTVCGNGTFAGLGTVGHAITENTMIIGNGVNATRHTTNGTSFTDTTGAPIAAHFTDYSDNRIYAGGTASSLFWSNVGTPTDWLNDSSSINIPGPGKFNGILKAADRIITSKNSGVMHVYDGYNLKDIATRLGPTSHASIADVEDYRFYLNRLGVFGFGGGKPELVSNSIEKQIYNDANTGIPGTAFDNAPGGIYRYEYIFGMGTAVTDDLTSEQIINPLGVYDYQANEFFNWSFGVRPTSFMTYKDAGGVDRFVFGDSNGQCYTYGGTTSDNGQPISVYMQGVLHANTLRDKKWRYLRFMFNPGAQAQLQIALSDTFTLRTLVWKTLAGGKDGVVEAHFPEGSRSKLLFWRITEASTQARLNFYAGEYEAEIAQAA